jgi:hypothetical protein
MKTNFRISLDDMILMSLGSILKRKPKCSFGDLVYECFRNYPQHFSLREYPNYPDSLKLDRPLRNLRLKGFIKGSPVTHYSFTSIGGNYINRLNKLYKGKVIPDTTTATRSPIVRKLNKIKNSKDFKGFLDKKNKYFCNDMIFRSLLETTLETPKENIIQEIDILLQQANKQKENSLFKYLKKHEKYYKEPK